MIPKLYIMVNKGSQEYTQKGLRREFIYGISLIAVDNGSLFDGIL